MNCHGWASLCALTIYHHHLSLLKFPHKRHLKNIVVKVLKAVSIITCIILFQEKAACSSPIPAHTLSRYLMKSTAFAPLRQVYPHLIGDLQVWRIMKSHSDTAFFLHWKASNVVFPCIFSSGRD